MSAAHVPSAPVERPRLVLVKGEGRRRPAVPVLRPWAVFWFAVGVLGFLLLAGPYVVILSAASAAGACLWRLRTAWRNRRHLRRYQRRH